MAITFKNPLTIVQQAGGEPDSYGTITYLDGNNAQQTVEMATESDFMKLTYGGSGIDVTVNGMTIGKNSIVSVTVGDGVSYVPSFFMYGCSNAETVVLPSSVRNIGPQFCAFCTKLNSTLNLENVIHIDSGFLQGCTMYNQPINLPNVIYIGTYFLANCTAFNSTVSLNDNAEVIKDSFMASCTSFAQPFTIPSGLYSSTATPVNPGHRFMNGCSSFTGPLVCNSLVLLAGGDNYRLATTSATAPMYVTGVTLTGPYAQAWKDAFPDRTSSPYRKLIVGS